MPALLAYLMALAIFLASSYEALNWLGAPELKVVVRAKHKANVTLPESEANSVREPLMGQASVASNNVALNAEKPLPQSSGEAAVNPAKEDPYGKVDKHGARGKVSSQNTHPTASRPIQEENSFPRTRVAHAPISPKRKLKLMTLETIEFPDGRRTNRLVPYRGEARALAFSADR
jgi:hypothetical protein